MQVQDSNFRESQRVEAARWLPAMPHARSGTTCLSLSDYESYLTAKTRFLTFTGFPKPNPVLNLVLS